MDGEGSGGRGNKAAAPNQSNFSSFSLHGFGDFETLETRIKKALDSPSLQVWSVFNITVDCRTVVKHLER